ncbi:hypothetical protein [Anaeromyxobacter oryzisoli]|uniref:hypothetical protein n=1 Tax=Anaeromyxobacter oryzisoli TaxID=2925408 RepID=UPI001F57B39B|nr:hypothetical protein [Anaeromyxobacter sp. SG63]
MSLSSPGAGLVKFAYDSAGNLIQKQDSTDATGTAFAQPTVIDAFRSHFDYDECSRPAHADAGVSAGWTAAKLIEATGMSLDDNGSATGSFGLGSLLQLAAGHTVGVQTPCHRALTFDNGCTTTPNHMWFVAIKTNEREADCA